MIIPQTIAGVYTVAYTCTLVVTLSAISAYKSTGMKTTA